MNDYYIIPDIKELGETINPERQEYLRRRIAVNIGDPEVLNRLLGLTDLDPDHFYPDQKAPELSTVDTIDAFLGKFGSNLPGSTAISETAQTTEDDEEPEAVIPVAPAVDYLTLLELERPQPGPAQRVRPVENTNEPPDLTESFAKVLIKNGNYSRAYEILEQIHLKNPEKSIYFADQMRFLRKLIAVSAGKNSSAVGR